MLLFYDGRRSLVSSLRSLLQAREGHTWTLGLPSDVVHLVTHFTSQLLEDKLVHKILGEDILDNVCSKNKYENIKINMKVVFFFLTEKKMFFTLSS